MSINCYRTAVGPGMFIASSRASCHPPASFAYENGPISALSWVGNLNLNCAWKQKVVTFRTAECSTPIDRTCKRCLHCPRRRRRPFASCSIQLGRSLCTGVITGQENSHWPQYILFCPLINVFDWQSMGQLLATLANSSASEGHAIQFHLNKCHSRPTFGPGDMYSGRLFPRNRRLNLCFCRAAEPNDLLSAAQEWLMRTRTDHQRQRL